MSRPKTRWQCRHHVTADCCRVCKGVRFDDYDKFKDTLTAMGAEHQAGTEGYGSHEYWLNGTRVARGEEYGLDTFSGIYVEGGI